MYVAGGGGIGRLQFHVLLRYRECQRGHRDRVAIHGASVGALLHDRATDPTANRSTGGGGCHGGSWDRAGGGHVRISSGDSASASRFQTEPARTHGSTDGGVV